MKYFYIFLALVYANFLLAQQFVHPSNEWLADDCCYAVGQTNCTTYRYWFEDSVIIGSNTYYQLKTNNQNPFLFQLGGFYREENGRVFVKDSESEEEYIIYDFNLETGEQLEIGNAEYSFTIEVLSIDSITLNTGEKRKRMEVGDATFPDTKTFWIEGVGSALSPMNPLYMFFLDCWNDFNCFRTDNIVAYQLGSCQLTSTSKIDLAVNQITCYPNPATNELIVSAINDDKITGLEILDLRGNTIFRSVSQELGPIEISGFSSGMYFAKVTFENGKIGISRFIKAAN